MEVVITGSSGLIGTALKRHLTAAGHRPIGLVRRPPRPDEDAIEWDPAAGRLDAESLSGIDAVVNLAGAGIGDRRWTDSYRDLLVSSRTDTTALLATTCAGLRQPPSVFVSGSAIGYYGDRGSEVLTETSEPGQGFLADLCQAWEGSAQAAADSGIRTAFIRTGLVFSTEGGVLPRLLPLFKLGLGGRLGSGQQFMSWITIDDEIAAIDHVLSNPEISGPVNLTAPGPVSNAEFTATLAKVLGRPSLLPVPAFGPRLLLGSGRANGLLFEGQRVMPEVLTSSGFGFEHPTLEQALSDLLASG